MKSNKQRRAEIKQARQKRAQKKYVLERGRLRKEVTANTAPCNASLLAPNHSCSDPPFMHRGCYYDLLFKCKDCGKEEVWTASQQKWWYETAKGDVWSTANRCRACRRKERERKNEARNIYFEGLRKKQSKHA